jgi:hypothetical protein
MPTSPRTVSSGIRCIAFRPMRRNTLLGFATVEHGSGLVLSDCPVHEKDGRSWAAAPGKPMVGADGSVMREPDTGKVRYTAIVTFVDDATRRRWSDAAVAAVRRDHPEAFEAPTSPAAPTPAAARPAAHARADDLIDDEIPF